MKFGTHSDCGCFHYLWGIELCHEHQKKYEELQPLTDRQMELMLV
jgi:hypothetical protein